MKDAVSDPVKVAETIYGLLPSVKSGSLVVFGDAFGGRIDNIHSVVAATVGDSGQLVVMFNLGETLEVWNPTDVTVDHDSFRIGDARRVRWEWPYYGRPDLPENRGWIEHTRSGNEILVSTADAGVPSVFAPSARQPAVELVSMADELSGRWTRN